MKLKFPIILTLLILLPLIVLTWMGSQLLRNNRVVQEHQQQQLVNSQLRTADQKILNYFTELENALLELPSFKTTSTTQQSINADLVRGFIQESPYIENIFVLNAQGKLLFPNKQSASNKEQMFINKTAELWSSMQAFKPNTPADLDNNQQKSNQVEQYSDPRFSVSGALGKLATRSRKTKTSEAELSADQIATDQIATIASNQAPITGEKTILKDKSTAAIIAGVQIPSEEIALAERQDTLNTGHGWTVWRTGTESQVFFWFWNEQNQLTGLKLIKSFWLSELISRLPDDRTADELIGNARIQLLNEKQALIYQWGAFEHSLTENILPLGQRILSHPLDGWRLAYFSPNKNNNNLQWLFYLGLLLSLSLLIFGLGLYIWREYQRDMRIAEQRVTFVNQVSHELKTPLTNICLYAEMLESEYEDYNPNEKISKYTQVLRTESQRLGRLINNVLSFSRSQQTEKHEQHINKTMGDIDDIIRSTVEVFKPSFSAKGIEIGFDLNAKNQCLFDHNALEQILNNLLGNIEKYAAKGKYAHIASYSQGETTEIHVLDHGPGISKTISKRLFEPFFRGSEKLTEGVSGTGIGLSIARTLCRLHGGDLVLKNSKNEHNNGAHFIASLNTSQDKPNSQKHSST